MNSSDIWEVLNTYACISWYWLGSDEVPSKYNSDITLLNYSVIYKYFTQNSVFY